MAAQTVTVLRNEEKDDCVDIQGRQGSRSLASTLLEDVIRHKEWKKTQSYRVRGVRLGWDDQSCASDPRTLKKQGQGERSLVIMGDFQSICSSLGLWLQVLCSFPQLTGYLFVK